MRIWCRTKEARAIGRRCHLVGNELSDFRELLPVRRGGEVIAGLGLELLLHLRILEDVLAVVEQHHVAIVGEAVNLIVDLHLVVAVGGRDVLQLVGVAVLLDKGIQLLQRSCAHEVGHPRGDHVQRVIGGSTRTVVLHDLCEHLVGRHFDHVDLDAGKLFPLGPRVVERVK